jgi:hypothetical protein
MRRYIVGAVFVMLGFGACIGLSGLPRAVAHSGNLQFRRLVLRIQKES